MSHESHRVTNLDVIQKLRDLQLAVPANYTGEGVFPRQKDDFDPNLYFTVLDRISVKPGYVLDFLYCKSFVAGYPCLYFRRTYDPQIKTYAEFESWRSGNEYLSYLVLDGSPDSFFQLVVFRLMGGQFYQWWHARYNDTVILTKSFNLKNTPTKIDKHRAWINEKMGLKTKTDVPDILDPTPTVHFRGQLVEVVFYVYTRHGGYFESHEFFRHRHPHLSEGSESLLLKANHPDVVY